MEIRQRRASQDKGQMRAMMEAVAGGLAELRHVIFIVPVIVQRITWNANCSVCVCVCVCVCLLGVGS
jgi:hypothetical protein